MPQGPNNFAESLMRERISVGWPWRLMVSMFLVFLISLLIYTGLTFGYKPFLKSSVESLESEIESFSAQLSSEQKENFVNFYSQLTNLQRLLKGHAGVARFFSLLESLTGEEVSYSGFSLSLQEKTVSLEGVASSYEALVGQLTLYEASPEINRVILDSSKSLGKVVQFKVKLVFRAEVFRSQP